MRQVKSLTLFNAFSFTAQAGLFYIVHSQLFNQNLTRQITNPYHSLLMPASSISLIVWGVIYTALTIFCLYHIKMAFTHHEKYPANQDARRVDMFFIINNLVAACWILVAINGKLMASLVLLAFQLFLLAIIHRQLNIHTRHRRVKSTVCTQGPLSIYAAWLSLLFMGGISEYFQLDTARWNQVLMGILIFISLLIVFIRHNILFGLMIIAGLYGIISNVDIIGINDPKSITLAAWAGIWILSLATLLKFVMDFQLRESSVIYHRAA